MYYAHQQKIIDEDKKKCGLFLGTGSGKTRTALALAKGKTLIICPKTQKEDGNWERDNINGNTIEVVSKEHFRRDFQGMRSFDTIIVDEAHTCLGVTPNTRQRKKQIIPKASQLFEALQEFIARTNPERLYLVTATPIRSPMTVWAAGILLGKDWNFYQFRDTFYTRLPMPGREVYTPKTDSATKERLANAVKSIGYTGRLEDFFDVPEQTYKVDYVQLNDAQKKRLKEIKLEYPEPIVQIGKRHQIENGVLAGDEYNKPEEFPCEKIDRILDYALEFPKMVVFAKYTAQIDQISSILRADGYRVIQLTGATKDRGAVILEAQNSPECIVVAQAQVSAGYELPDFPVMIFASMSWSIVDRVQAEGRILRANHLKKNLYITLVTKGGIDEAVFKAIEQKQDFNEKLFVDRQPTNEKRS